MEPVMLLRLGYVLLISALALFVGYVGYWVLKLIFGIVAIPLFLKVIIALVLAGLVLVIAGLVWERVREEKEERR